MILIVGNKDAVEIFRPAKVTILVGCRSLTKQLISSAHMLLEKRKGPKALKGYCPAVANSR